MATNENQLRRRSSKAHALKELGHIDWTCHGSRPTSSVYRHATGTRTFVAWNPTSKPQVVEFFAEGKSLGKLNVPAHSTGSSQVLVK